MRFNALHDLFSGFDVRVLDVYCAHAKLLIAQVVFIVGRHIVFDQISVALDLAN